MLSKQKFKHLHKCVYNNKGLNFDFDNVFGRNSTKLNTVDA